ncbi:MAG: HAD family phosphatase [Candidatus Neomarinimicrobiota bacterium]|jgi:putative hydrolase of the HAD superfamily|nr:HAD family phosphatase [Candidatus Neomarinimicrobiota bacterium]MDX9780143.1 HAD family phosphatase [bacterium]
MNIPKGHIQDLVFDLGNVLVDVEYSRFTAYMGWDPAKFMRFYATEFFREFETGRRDEAACFREMAHYVPLKEEDIPRYRANIYRTFPLRPRTLALLPALRKKFRLYLFSNTNSLDFNAISRRIRFPDLFDGVYTSHEQGFLKPNPEAYEKIEDLFGLKAETLLYFDDRFENIEAGIRAGWPSLQVKDEETFLKILRDLSEQADTINPVFSTSQNLKY